MERSKHDLTGNDFDPLFDALSEDSTNLVEEMMRESYNSFKSYIEHHLNHVDTTLSLIGTETQQTVGNGNAGISPHARILNAVGSTVFSHAGCPPPHLASSAAFDDTIVKLLGDCGGTDEFLWDSLQDIELENSSLRVRANGQLVSSTDLVSQSQPLSQGQLSDGTAIPVDAPYIDQRGHADDPMELIRRHGKSLMDSLNNYQNEQAALARREESLTESEGVHTVGNIDSSSSFTDLKDGVRLIQSYGALSNRSVSNARAASWSMHETSTVRLGKRGRYFLDVWDEEDFVSRMKGPTRLRPLQKWEDLFKPGYSDNHDGCYRDWLLGQQEAAKTRIHDAQLKKSKRRSSDPIFRYDLGPGRMENSGLAALVAPPVPVAIQHPASWAVRSRNGGQTNAAGDGAITIDVNTIHPASVTSTTIHPMHQKNRRSVQAAHPSAAAPMDVEDVDDFNIYADRLQQALRMEEVANFVRLSRMQSSMRVHSNPQIKVLHDKRRKLEELMSQAAQSMEPTSVDRVVYAFKPQKQSGAAAVLGRMHGDELAGRAGQVLKLDLQGNVIPRKFLQEAAVNGQNRYNTRCAEGSASSSGGSSSGGSSNGASVRPEATRLRRDMLGGSSARQVATGVSLAQCLVPEVEVEVCIGKRWQVATVCRVVYDGEHIRHVKVMPQDCTALESVWVSVEDGKLAPYGTHLRPVAAPSASAANSTASANVKTVAENEVPEVSGKGVLNEKENPAEVSEAAAVGVAVAPIAAVVSRESSTATVNALPSPPQQADGCALAVPTIHSHNEQSVLWHTTGIVEKASASAVPRPSVFAPAQPLHAAQVASLSAPQANWVYIPASVATPPNVDTFRQAPVLLGLVSDPRLRRGHPSLQDLHGPNPSRAHSLPLHHSQQHNNMLSVGPGLGLPIHSSSFGYAGSISMDANNNHANYAARIKIPLPLGTTDKRDLIPSVHPYTPLPFAPQPFHAYAHQRFDNGQAGRVPLGGLRGVPYEYEYEGAEEVQQRSVFDLGGHTMASGEGVAQISGGAYPSNGAYGNVHEYGHSEGSGGVVGQCNGYVNGTAPLSAATASTNTFRLGKKGAITRN